MGLNCSKCCQAEDEAKMEQDLIRNNGSIAPGKRSNQMNQALNTRELDETYKK